MKQHDTADRTDQVKKLIASVLPAKRETDALDAAARQVTTEGLSLLIEEPGGTEPGTPEVQRGYERNKGRGDSVNQPLVPGVRVVYRNALDGLVYGVVVRDEGLAGCLYVRPEGLAESCDLGSYVEISGDMLARLVVLLGIPETPISHD